MKTNSMNIKEGFSCCLLSALQVFDLTRICGFVQPVTNAMPFPDSRTGIISGQKVSYGAGFVVVLGGIGVAAEKTAKTRRVCRDGYPVWMGAL